MPGKGLSDPGPDGGRLRRRSTCSGPPGPTLIFLCSGLISALITGCGVWDGNRQRVDQVVRGPGTCSGWSTSPAYESFQDSGYLHAGPAVPSAGPVPLGIQGIGDL